MKRWFDNQTFPKELYHVWQSLSRSALWQICTLYNSINYCKVSLNFLIDGKRTHRCWEVLYTSGHHANIMLLLITSYTCSHLQDHCKRCITLKVLFLLYTYFSNLTLVSTLYGYNMDGNRFHNDRVNNNLTRKSNWTIFFAHCWRRFYDL